MLNWLVERIGLPAYERLGGRRAWSQVRHLRALQWRSHDEIAARTVTRLRAIAAHAVAETPYYWELFGEAGLDPAGLRTLDDLGQLHISTRQQLREAFPERVVAASVPETERLMRRTSGSTGTPFSFFVDRTDADSWVGSHLFFLQDWAGAKVWHNQLLIAGAAG